MLRSAIKNLFVIVVSCVLMVVWSLCLLWTGKEVRGMESAELQKTESQQDQGLAHDQPQISFDSTHYDAGEVREGTEVSHTYRVKNTGASTLNIKGVSVGWGCTVASFDKAILPGQEGNIVLKVNTLGRKGVFSKNATVYSNDPRQPKIEITISCIIKQYISVEPDYMIKLVGFEGDRIKESITIISHEEQPLRITDITSTIRDKIDYTLKTIKKGKEYALEVKNRSRKKDTFGGEVVLKTDSPRKSQIMIHINGQIKAELVISPRSLSFGTINATGENVNEMSLSKTVRLNDVRGAGLIIKKIKPSSEWVITETKSDEGGRGYVVIITLDKERVPKGNFKEKVEIYTNYKKKPLVVDLAGEVL